MLPSLFASLRFSRALFAGAGLFLHYFTFLDAAPAQSDLDTWKNYLATLDDQMRETMLADPTVS